MGVEPEVDIESNTSDESALSTIVDAIGTYFGHMPAAIRKNVAKAFGHMMKIPNAYLDGWVAEIKATSDARVSITKATGKALAKSVEVDRSLAAIATNTHASRILRQQINAAKVLEQAAQEIGKSPPPDNAVLEDISEDWLNAFEREAIDMSSEHMQKLFGKILAGEIRKPASYSIRTVKLMAQLDNRAAVLFRTLCSLACTIKVGIEVLDARVVAIAGSASDNGLQNFGLGFGQLNTLFEYGLIIGDYNSYMMYFGAIGGQGQHVQLPIKYQGREYSLVPKTPLPQAQRMDFRVNGVQLSRAGTELLSIVEAEENVAYTAALTEYFDGRGFAVTLNPPAVNMPAPGNS